MAADLKWDKADIRLKHYALVIIGLFEKNYLWEIEHGNLHLSSVCIILTSKNIRNQIKSYLFTFDKKTLYFKITIPDRFIQV